MKRGIQVACIMMMVLVGLAFPAYGKGKGVIELPEGSSL